MKLFRNMGKYPFMMLLSTSAVILTVTAYMGKNSVYADYSVDLLKHPRLAVVFEGLKDKNYPWEVLIDNKAKNIALGDSTIEENQGSNQNTGGNTVQSSDSNTDSAGNTAQGTDGNVIGKDTKENDGNKAGDGIQGTDKDTTGNDSKNSSQSGSKEDAGSNNDTTGSDAGGTSETKGEINGETKEEINGETKEEINDGTKGNNETDKAGESGQSSNEFVTVKESYFDDALFIGDSRTVGLADYSGWKNPTFYADVGLTIYDVFDKKIADVGGKKVTIEEALQKKSFQKIYIMLGINEMGTGTAKSFTKAYKEVVERIEELQPDAIIFVEAIMNVAKEKSDTDPIFNNTNIKDRNNHLVALADNKKIFYIDVNEAITDSTGGIPAEYTFDNIHLKAAYYKIWTDFLLKHGVKVK